MEKCKYNGFEFLSYAYDICPQDNLIIDKMIQAINEVPADKHYIELLARSLSEVISRCGIKWSSLQDFNWGNVNQPYCFRLYMHYAMLMAKDNMRANKHILFDALRRFNGNELGWRGVRGQSQWNFYLRQYIRLYGLDDKINELVD